MKGNKKRGYSGRKKEKGLMYIGKLTILSGTEAGRQYYLKGQRVVELGRAKTSTIRLKDSLAAMNHCRIYCDQDSYILYDLNTQAGTYVNGKRIQKYTVQNGDRIRIGSTIFEFQLVQLTSVPAQERKQFSERDEDVDGFRLGPASRSSKRISQHQEASGKNQRPSPPVSLTLENRGQTLEPLHMSVAPTPPYIPALPSSLLPKRSPEEEAKRKRLLTFNYPNIQSSVSRLATMQGSRGACFATSQGDYVYAESHIARYNRDFLHELSRETLLIGEQIRDSRLGRPKSIIMEGTKGKFYIQFAEEHSFFLSFLSDTTLNMGLAMMLLSQELALLSNLLKI